MSIYDFMGTNFVRMRRIVLNMIWDLANGDEKRYVQLLEKDWEYRRVYEEYGIEEEAFYDKYENLIWGAMEEMAVESREGNLFYYLDWFYENEVLKREPLYKFNHKEVIVWYIVGSIVLMELRRVHIKMERLKKGK